jgi:hypothetical protein
MCIIIVAAVSLEKRNLANNQLGSPQQIVLATYYEALTPRQLLNKNV